ncbi:unnamed protein product, partial [Rotaria sp. Silwood1]
MILLLTHSTRWVLP